MTLNYRVIVKRYPFPSGWQFNSRCEIFSLLDEKKTSQLSKKPRAHSPQGTPPCTKRILEQGRANGLKFKYTKSVLMDLPIELKQPKNSRFQNICLDFLRYVTFNLFRIFVLLFFFKRLTHKHQQRFELKYLTWVLKYMQ